jgi:hypothetical protein
MGPFDSDTTPRLRASDADREATVERLRFAAVEGRLDADELDERLAAAYRARLCSELERLTEDVTPPPAARRAAARRVRSMPVRTTTNRLAVASLVLGLCWWLWFGSVAAIVTGHLALRQIESSSGTQTGRGLAVAGLLLGYLSLVPLLFGIVWGLF